MAPSFFMDVFKLFWVSPSLRHAQATARGHRNVALNGRGLQVLSVGYLTLMKKTLAIVADFDSKSKSHAATNAALAHSAHALGLKIEPRWINTAELAGGEKFLARCGGLWIGPGSPYANMTGVLAAIRLAREGGIPLLGTCGGFQHIILEYARNVLGFVDAEHEESAPEAARLFISRLACSLVGRTMTLAVEPGSMLHRIYGRSQVQEEYLCNFGVNPIFVDTLRGSGLAVVGSDEEGAVRAVELNEHPFFFGTLFLPQHNSTTSNPHPLVSAFLKACNC
jgi:CTP synthase (UTP-ammonia lyase)